MKLIQTQTSNIKNFLTGYTEFFINGISCSVAASVLNGKIEVLILFRNQY